MSSILQTAKGISQIPDNKLHVILGFPGSGKTTLAATYPKPMLFVQIGDDGGGIVMSDWGDKDISYILLETDKDGTIYMKLMQLLKELREQPTLYKTIVIDAYSSIEENMISTAVQTKGKTLSWDERGAITQAMVNLRDTIVNLSKVTPMTFVEISHLKNAESTDNISGETTVRYIPKMSQNNGNIMLERANNIMYCTRKVCADENGQPTVKFLTYIGAHPNIDTKYRYKSPLLKDDSGIYIEDCTYEKIIALSEPTTQLKQVNVIEPIKREDANPFNTQENKE
jgi:predicted ATPase